MSWPRAKYEDGLRIKEEEKQQVLNKMDMLKEHFNGHLMAYWLQDAFSGDRLLKLDLNILLKKFGFCEYCQGYIGVSPLLRKYKRILVLSSYCDTRFIKVTPKEKCQYYTPREPYATLILNHLWETCGYTVLDTWKKEMEEKNNNTNDNFQVNDY